MSQDPNAIRIVEVVNGIGFGGAELALIRRLRHQPANVRTTVISTDPELNELSGQVAALVDRLIEQSPDRNGSGSLAAMVAAEQPDLIIIHTPRGAFTLLRSPLARKVPCVVVVHATFSSPNHVLQPIVSALLTSVNHRAAMHIAVSTAAAAGSQAKRAGNMHICPLGGDLEPAAPTTDLWPSTARLRLLALSRLTASKNLTALIEASFLEADAMRARDAFLAIVGDGPMLELLSELIEQRGLSDIVRTHPAIVPASALLEEADELIVSSTSEGGPITIFEALLAGTRVTSTPVGVAPDVLLDDVGLHVLNDASTASLRIGLRLSLARDGVELTERRQ